MLTVVPVQPTTFHNHPTFYAKPSSCCVAALTIHWYPKCVPDHFQNLVKSLQVHNLPIFLI